VRDVSDPRALRIDLPAWAAAREDDSRRYATDEDRMRVAIEVAGANVHHGTGGPFGAAIFESESGRLVAIGVNSVVRLNNSTLHAEMVAFMRAQSVVGAYSLSAPGRPAHTLYASCDPCAMCLGASLWAGVKRIVCGATRQDVESYQFDEGPVFPESYAYLVRRGIEVDHGVLREEARAILDQYRARGGVIYNA
jgi:tRNA(Arg) A34 adenosine deaminase TadA